MLTDDPCLLQIGYVTPTLRTLGLSDSQVRPAPARCATKRLVTGLRGVVVGAGELRVAGGPHRRHLHPALRRPVQVRQREHEQTACPPLRSWSPERDGVWCGGSDYTTHSWGRRRIYILCGGLLSIAGLIGEGGGGREGLLLLLPHSLTCLSCVFMQGFRTRRASGWRWAAVRAAASRSGWPSSSSGEAPGRPTA